MVNIIILTGILESETGLHIGNMEGIGSPRGLDAPVLQNPILQKPQKIAPYISGTALKGKLRNIAECLCEHSGMSDFYDDNDKGEKFNFKRYYRHNCVSAESAKDCPVCYLFGCVTSKDDAKNEDTKHIVGRLIFRNMKFIRAQDRDENENEFKYENTLKRLIREANPRLIERVVPLSKFYFTIIYQQYQNDAVDHTAKMLSYLIGCMRFLEHFYLGGNGSRGYGKVKFCKGIELANEKFDTLADIQKALKTANFQKKLKLQKAEEVQ